MGASDLVVQPSPYSFSPGPSAQPAPLTLDDARTCIHERDAARAALAAETTNANAYAHERDDARRERDEANILLANTGIALGWDAVEGVVDAAKRVVRERDEARAEVANICAALGSSMNSINGYQRAAMRTTIHERGAADPHALAWNALGIAGEAGEVADLVKKHVGHGHALDRDKLAKELGDVLWYVAALAHDIGADLSTIASMNIGKLRRRYPDGFSTERSINRVEYTGSDGQPVRVSGEV